jgi:hypothetical protein
MVFMGHPCFDKSTFYDGIISKILIITDNDTTLCDNDITLCDDTTLCDNDTTLCDNVTTLCDNVEVSNNKNLRMLYCEWTGF